MTERIAGMSGHQSAASETVDWMTPPWLLAALGGAEAFDTDPCTPADAPWPTAKLHYTEVQNGLIQPWKGRVWLNPPYSTGPVGQFMSLLVRHGTGTALIFARTETAQFHANAWRGANAMLFLEGRLHFHVARDTTFYQKGKDPIFVKRGEATPTNAGAPSVLIAYGEEDTDRLAQCKIDGAFIPLRLRNFVLGFAEPGTWIEEVERILRTAQRPMAVGDLYKALASSPKARRNGHWRAKVRQTLQRGPFAALGNGIWELINTETSNA